MEQETDPSQIVTRFIFDENGVILRSATMQFDVKVLNDQLVLIRIWPEISDATLGVKIPEFRLEILARQALYFAQAIQSAAMVALDL